MTDKTTAGLDRVIGEYHGDSAGPCVIFVAGIHGNEPTGIDALRRVVDTLEDDPVPFAGDLHAFRGNIPALSLGERYIDKDLNRIWNAGHVESVRRARIGALSESEDRELRRLSMAIEIAAGAARGPVLVMDLHTSSAPSVPFIVKGTGALLTRVHERLCIPLITDRQHLLNGMMLDFLESRGYATLAFEAGQHGTEESIDVHEAAVWITLEGAGAVNRTDLLRYESWQKELSVSLDGLPQKLELIHHHPITPGDGFQMLPGFQNFDSVSTGQALARDNKGTIRSPADGRIFLPLYQSVGDDGFFLVS